MVERQPNILVRLIKGIWHLIDGMRRVVLNVIFFGILLFVLALMFGDHGVIVQDRTALILNPTGIVVEQFSTDATDRFISRLQDREIPETRMRDLLDAIERAKTDSRIDRLVIRPDYMWGIGFSKLQELKTAIEDFKTSGKQVISYSEGMAQQQYYLASLADEIWLHPEGLIFLEGFSVYRNYYKDGLDKLEVDVHLFRVGEYKSAAEPYVRSDMSEESRTANQYWLGDLWQQYLNDVAGQRELDPNDLQDMINNFAAQLERAGGRPADAALQAGLVDKIAGRREFIKHISGLGAYDSSEDNFRQIGFETYLAATELTTVSPASKKVAVIVAQGPIVYGNQAAGVIGGESTARLIQQAQNDDDVAAIVLRVDSPGGSVLPSEKIRQQLLAAKAAGKTIVVSMSSVAASGGYWVAMGADEIWANPGTITGSIGIFGMLTNFPRTLAKIGIHTDGVGTTNLAGAFRPDRPLNPEVGKVIQGIIDDGYQQFISRVAESRELAVEQVDSIARGRVWSGEQALDRGLVDQIGGLKQAIASAADLAGVGQYTVKYLEQEPSTFEKFLLDLTASVPQGVLASNSWSGLLTSGLNGQLPSDIQLLMQQPADRVGVYAYCFCTIE